jgi:hypothetical protein
MGVIVNQLKSQTLDEVLATAFKQVGGVVFPDERALASLDELVRIVEAWRATHAISYGCPIPNEGTDYSAAPSSVDSPVNLVAPSTTESVVVNAISATNSGAAPVVGTVTLGDGVILTAFSTPPGASEPIALPYPVWVTKGAVMAVTVTSGTPGDLAVKASAVKAVI